MKGNFIRITIIACLLCSCSEKKQGDLPEIPVDIHKNDLLSLQEIAEEITAIEFELTDESVFSPNYIQNIVISENEVFIAGMQKIYVFSKEGKFIRTIGSKGQGPGEYLGISRIALDEKNRRLFINSSPKILSYDLTGNFLKEKQLSVNVVDINYINEELLLLINKEISGSKGICSHSAIWRLNDDLWIVDSCTIRDLSLEGLSGSTLSWSNDFILRGSESVYVYYGDFFFEFGVDNMLEKVLRDTLYRFENNQLIPELKLQFKNDSKFINLYSIYRSSRYIFAIYRNANSPGTTVYCFCYDTKTGKGYNMKNGYADDINGIDKPVVIRPFNLDTEMFYYLHTNMKPSDLEEPNPTLYIGRLKK